VQFPDYLKKKARTISWFHFPYTHLHNHAMSHKILTFILMLNVTLGFFGSAAYAVVVVKANNTTNLTQGGSWVGGSTPGIADTAKWDSTVTAANSISLGGTFYVNEISTANPGGPVTINDDGSVLGLYGLGGTGIDMSAATQDLTINCMVGLGSTQTWNVGSGQKLDVEGTINGAYGIVIVGDGIATLGGHNGYTGGTTVTSGILRAGGRSGDENVFGPEGSSVTVQSGATLDLNGSYALGERNYVIWVSGAGVDGNGAIIDSGYSGWVRWGVKNIALAGDVTLGSLTINGSVTGHQRNLTKTGSGTLSANGPITAVSNIYITAGIMGVNSSVTGAKSIYINGGMLAVGGAIDDSQAGSIYVNTSGILNAGQSVIEKPIVMAGGVFQCNGYANTTVTGAVSLNATGNFFLAAYSALTLNGAISDGTGSNGINVSNGGTLLLGAASAYSGDTVVTFGTLKIGADNAVPGGIGKGNVNLGMGSTLDTYGRSVLINGLSGYGAIDNTNGTGTLSIGNNNVTSTFYGAIQNTAGTLSVIKQGTGTQTLAGAAIYSGSTTVNGGTLAIAGGIDPSGTSLIDVGSGAAIFKTVSVSKSNLNIYTASSTKFEVADHSHTVGIISGSGTTQVDAGASLTAQSISQGTLTLGNGATVTIQTIPGGPLSNQIVPVPEPSSLVLLSAAFFSAIYVWARKRIG
jgi:fibronectin-binding autotransporter adhesin